MTEVQEEIVEKAARAIWMVGQDWNDPSVFEDMPDYGQDVWLDRARAALLASGLPAAIEARDKALELLRRTQEYPIGAPFLRDADVLEFLRSHP